jgi:hypothetical protein
MNTKNERQHPIGFGQKYTIRPEALAQVTDAYTELNPSPPALPPPFFEPVRPESRSGEVYTISPDPLVLLAVQEIMHERWSRGVEGYPRARPDGSVYIYNRPPERFER